MKTESVTQCSMLKVIMLDGILQIFFMVRRNWHNRIVGQSFFERYHFIMWHVQGLNFVDLDIENIS